MALSRGAISRNFFSKWKNSVYFLSTSISGDNHPNILRSESKDVEIPDATITEVIYDHINPFSTYIATESAITGKKYTFEQIRIKSRNFSKNLRHKFKIQDGDVISFFLPNNPEYSICFLGSLEARLVITTMNHMYTSDEIAKQIKDAKPKIVITAPSYLNTLKSAFNMLKINLPTIIIKDRQDESIPAGTIDFFEMIDTVIDIPDIQPGKSTDIAIMPYSSGTTGLPKGVELSHKNIVANLTQIDTDHFRHFIKPSENFQEITPGIMPLYHIYGMTLNFISLYHGVRSITLPQFTPKVFLSVLEKNPCTIIFGAPPLVLFLTAHPDVKPEYLKNLRLMSSGAAPLGYMDEERFIKKTGSSEVYVMQGYGLTETSPIISMTPKNLERTENTGGSVGKLVPNTILKMINPDDPHGTPLGPNETGELLIKGPQVMKGYYNKPEETKQTFLNGWLRTGDIGYYNENNLIYISDRLKELIKVKGFQVPPAEIEEIIRDYPHVEDAAVVGIPHPTYGEVPRAYVIPKKDTALNVDELNKYVTAKVVSYKKLAGGIEIVDSIPKNPSGKILRRKIKEDYLRNNA